MQPLPAFSEIFAATLKLLRGFVAGALQPAVTEVLMDVEELAHFRSTGHPVIRSYQPGKDWWHCYLDDLVFQNKGAPSFEYS